MMECIFASGQRPCHRNRAVCIPRSSLLHLHHFYSCYCDEYFCGAGAASTFGSRRCIVNGERPCARNSSCHRVRRRRGWSDERHCTDEFCRRIASRFRTAPECDEEATISAVNAEQPTCRPISRLGNRTFDGTREASDRWRTRRAECTLHCASSAGNVHKNCLSFSSTGLFRLSKVPPCYR